MSEHAPKTTDWEPGELLPRELLIKALRDASAARSDVDGWLMAQAATMLKPSRPDYRPFASAKPPSPTQSTIQAAAEALVRSILADQNPSDELVRVVAAKVCRAVTYTDPVEELARRLHFKAEHLDPSEDPDWDAMTERKRDFWRALVSDMLVERELMERAWTEKA